MSLGEDAKPFISKVSKQVVMSFCVAGVALCDILLCLQACRKAFCVAGAILLRQFQTMSWHFGGRRGTLETSIVILRGRRSTLHVSCCMFFGNRIVRAPLSTLHAVHFILDTPHFTLYTPHYTLYTLHLTLHTLHFALHTLHFTLSSPHL
jgi:hypothetical protein